MPTIAQLEEQQKNLKQPVLLRDLAVRLSKNRDFQKLILEEFCVNEAARYVQNSSNPALDAAGRADSLAIAQASGHLRRWLSVVCQMGDRAEVEIEQIGEAIEELRTEGVDDGPDEVESLYVGDDQGSAN